LYGAHIQVSQTTVPVSAMQNFLRQELTFIEDVKVSRDHLSPLKKVLRAHFRIRKYNRTGKKFRRFGFRRI
jgi:hypothetical protein